MSAAPPTPVDRYAALGFGRYVGLASFFTRLGRTYAIVPAAAAIGAIDAGQGRGAWFAASLFASQTFSQCAIAALKAGFGRPRPAVWLRHAERGRAFPSGHAATALVFYAPLAARALRARGLPKPAAATLTCALAICVAGIPWSRIALGAHYATDVMGGLLFGAAWTFAARAVLPD